MVEISVFLTDWQILFREGIHFTLSGEEDIEVIGESTNSEDALNFIKTNPPDVLVINANGEESNGIKVTRYLKQNFPSVAVVVIMDNEDEESLINIIKSGASAYLTKNAEPDDVINTIREVAQGNKPVLEMLLKPTIASRLLSEFEEFVLIGEQVDNLIPQMTQTEEKILHMIVEGNSLEEICQSLRKNEESIRKHLGFILSKLVANDHIREVIEAAQNGLLSLIFRARLAGKPTSDYITRGEFSAFKDTIMDRFHIAIDDIS